MGFQWEEEEMPKGMDRIEFSVIDRPNIGHA